MQVFCGSAGRCSELAKGMGLGHPQGGGERAHKLKAEPAGE